jgi:hypothetical protein
MTRLLTVSALLIAVAGLTSPVFAGGSVRHQCPEESRHQCPDESMQVRHDCPEESRHDCPDSFCSQ